MRSMTARPLEFGLVDNNMNSRIMVPNHGITGSVSLSVLVSTRCSEAKLDAALSEEESSTLRVFATSTGRKWITSRVGAI